MAIPSITIGSLADRTDGGLAMIRVMSEIE
jgi:hypothetical protein